MEIYKIVLIGIIAAVMIVMLKELKSEMAVIVAVAAGVIILIMTASMLADVVEVFSNIADKSGIDNSLYIALIKIIGIGYLTEFAANICEDAGSKSVAGKILLGGKICIMIVALPVVQALIDIIIAII